MDKTTGIKDAYYNNSLSLSLCMFPSFSLLLSPSLSVSLFSFGQWGELRFQCPGFHTRLCGSYVCVRACVQAWVRASLRTCVCVCVHVAAKCVNVNLQGLFIKTHAYTLLWCFTGQCEVGHCSPDTNMKKFSKEGNIILDKENNFKPRKCTCSFLAPKMYYTEPDKNMQISYSGKAKCFFFYL